MPEYFMVAQGHDNVLGLANFVPYQPKTPGFQWTRRIFFVGGGFRDEGGHIIFRWGQITEPQYQALLGQCGLSAAKYAPITLHAQDDAYNWVNFNGWAARPQLGVDFQRDGFWLTNVRVLFKKLELVV